MTHNYNRQDQTTISATVEQLSLLSTNDTCGKEKQSASCVHEIEQHAIAMAQHDKSIIEEQPGGTILSTSPNLPNEIVSLIFSYIRNSPSTLYACSLANKRYNDLANSILWKTPDFLNHRMATRFLDCMASMSDQRRITLGRLIHDLRLNHIPLTKKRRSQLLPHMSNLQHLTLANCDAQTAIHQLPPLTSLKLNKAFVTESEFDAIAQCPLEAFDWNLGVTQSPVWLTRLARCPLHSLSVHCRATAATIARFSTLRNIQQLTAADIARLPTTPFASFLTNPSTFPQLTYLGISRGFDINDVVLAAFFKHHPRLEQLHLSHQFALTDAALDAIVLPHLKRASLIYLPHITSPAVRRLINVCPLIYLDISGCEQVVPSDFPELSVTRIGVLDQGALDNIRHSMIV